MVSTQNNDTDLSKKALFTPLYPDLKRIAQCHMRQETLGHTLQPTALINEAYMRLMAKEEDRVYNNQKHFLCVASEVMRRILIDSARSKKSQKRGGNFKKVELNEDTQSTPDKDYDLLAINEALAKMDKIYPKKAEVIKLRFFGGLTVDEIAETLNISKATTNNYWNFGKSWLYREMEK